MKTELRIGNFFDIKDVTGKPSGLVCKVVGLGFARLWYVIEGEEIPADVSYKTVRYENVLGIPITKQWLDDSDFIKTIVNESTNYKITGCPYSIYHSNVQCTLVYNNEYYEGEIEYIHQIQNINFRGIEIKMCG